MLSNEKIFSGENLNEKKGNLLSETILSPQNTQNTQFTLK